MKIELSLKSFSRIILNKLKKNLFDLFLWIGFNCLKTRSTLKRQFTFCHKVPRNFWYLFYKPRKDGRLSQPWSQPLVLKMGPLDPIIIISLFLIKITANITKMLDQDSSPWYLHLQFFLKYTLSSSEGN